MELGLYLDFKTSRNELIQYIKEALSTIGVTCGVFKDEGELIYFGCKSFSLHIDTEDMYCQNSVSEQYNITVDLLVDIEVYSKTYETGIVKAFEFCAEFLKHANRDAILLKSTSSNPIFKKHIDKIEYGEDSELLDEIAMLKKIIKS